MKLVALLLALLPSALLATTSATLTPAGNYLLPTASTVTFTATVSGQSATTSAIGWSLTLPSGWAYVSGTGEPEVKPTVGQTATLEWVYLDIPSTPSFTVTVSYPAGIAADKTFASAVIVRDAGTRQDLTPTVVTLSPATAPVVTNTGTTSGTYASALSLGITATSPITIDSYAAVGLPTGLSVNPTTGAITGTPTQSGSFTVALKATNAAGTGSADVTLAIAKVPLTVTANAASRAYGAADPTFAVTITGFVNSDTAAGAVSGLAAFTTSAVTTSPIGSTYTITPALGGLTAANYTFATFNPGVLTITAKPITVTATAGQSKVYGGVDPTLTYAITSGGSLVGLDTFTGSLSRAAGENIGGTYAIAQNTLSLSANYALTFVPANFAITAKAITVTADSGQTKVYGSADPTFSYTITSGGPALVSGDTFTGALGRAPGASIGSYAITQSSLSAGNNYTITFVPANFAITAKPITVTADSGQTKVYGSADPAFTYAITNGGPALVSGDSFSGALARATGETVGSAYAINVGTLTAGNNYTLTFVPANFAITKKNLTITADDKTRPFQSSDPTFTATITGFAFTDTAASALTGSVALSSTAVHSSNPGTYPITAALGDLAATNYGFTFVNGTLTITATYHSADTSGDWTIDLAEVTRVIELYNTRVGTTRTGAYRTATTTTEDGYDVGAGAITGNYHSADQNHDGKIDLAELTRVVELFNFRSGPTRTGAYHQQNGTEDGYSAGP